MISLLERALSFLLIAIVAVILLVLLLKVVSAI